ncbi:hypothetical protein V5O48_005253 [Marasmius crinis-equi]|uniref:F-box domain-containing protein n=1 Tax=Marasmius crinis-equi TaxID=585013 RepID=A0ABR3FMX2_9AGAR
MICSYLPITTTLALLQVNQYFRYLLLDPESDSFWKVIRGVKKIPDGPDCMSELEWLQHLFRDAQLCDNCKGAYALTNWDTMRRYCATCTSLCTRGCTRIRPPIAAFAYVDAIPTYIDGQGIRRFVREDLTDIVLASRALPLPCRQTFMDQCKSTVNRQKEWACEVDDWFGNTIIGWFISDGICPGRHVLQELDSNHEFTRETVISGTEWTAFRSGGDMATLRAKFTPLFMNAATPRWADLRLTMDIAWDGYLRRQPKRIRFTAPDSRAIALFPFVRDVLILGSSSALDADNLQKLISDCSDNIFRWIAFMDKRLLAQSMERGHDPAVAEFCLQQHLTLSPPSMSIDGLGERELATTEIYCEGCDDVFSSVAAAMRHINRLSTLCFTSWTPSPSMLSLVSSPAALALVSCSGLDYDQATCHEMDRLWHSYSCIVCQGGFKGTWRECVKHFHNAGHKNGDNSYDFAFLFARLDPSVRNPLHPAIDKPQWHCGYCSRYLLLPATRSQILSHVVRAHHVNRNAFTVPGDFFYVGA